jgi:exopolyphosphatase/guanosine-5'-triphosphate,3'-diphosphate pyrophosphatase
MLVVDVASGPAAEGGGGPRWRECFRLRLPVRLGEGGFKAGQIAPDRFARGLDALGVLRECARNLGVAEVKVVGTSALRGAANGADFAAAVQRRLGWDLRIIDGLEEARLIHVGASAAYVPAPGGRVLTLDIGGGSVEAIVWQDRAVPLGSVSTDAGVGRVAAIAAPGDPMGERGAQRLAPFLADVMDPIRRLIAEHRPRILLGASGSFDTFADLAEGAAPPGGHRLARSVDRRALQEVLDRLRVASARERLTMPGMAPDRVDFMPISAEIVRCVLGWMEGEVENEDEIEDEIEDEVEGSFAGQDANASRRGVEVVCSPFALREGVVEVEVGGWG